MTLAGIDAHQNSKIGNWIICYIWNESRDEPLIYIVKLPLGWKNRLVRYFWQWLESFLPTPDRVIPNRRGFSPSSHGLIASSIYLFNGKTDLVHQSLRRLFGGPLRSTIPAYPLASTKTAYHPRLGAYHPMLHYIWAKTCLCILFFYLLAPWGIFKTSINWAENKKIANRISKHTRDIWSRVWSLEIMNYCRRKECNLGVIHQIPGSRISTTRFRDYKITTFGRRVQGIVR